MNIDESNDKRKPNILEDHKKIRKKLITPINQLPGGMKHVRWLDDILPELIWIGLLQEKCGINRSVEICLKVASINKNINDERIRIDKNCDLLSLILISHYSNMSSEELVKFKNALVEEMIFDEFYSANEIFLNLYPECPLSILFNLNSSATLDKNGLNAMKEFMNKYFYRREHLTNVMEATAGCMILKMDRVKYVNGTRPPEYNDILNFPFNSDKYNKAASSIRAQTLMFVAHDINNRDWSNYFWNRGLIIDGCE